MTTPELTVARVDKRYEVHDTAGKRVGGPYGSQWLADDRLERILAKARRFERPCITCHTTFLSEGAHHRMCTMCRCDRTEPLDCAVSDAKLPGSAHQADFEVVYK